MIALLYFYLKNIFMQCFQEYIFHILMSFKEKIVFMQSMFVIIKKGEIVELRFSCCCFDDSKCWIKIIWIYFYSMWKIFLLLKSYYSRFYLRWYFHPSNLFNIVFKYFQTYDFNLYILPKFDEVSKMFLQLKSYDNIFYISLYFCQSNLFNKMLKWF